MFRLQNKVPQVYVEQSRDFQLFCRLVDIIQNSTKFDIDSTIHLLEPFLTNDRMLELACTKVGFFPKHRYNADILRHIIAVFPFAIKNKGSKVGIEAAVHAIIKAENMTNTDYSNKTDVFIDTDEFGGVVINIYANYEIKNRNALDDILYYITPAGCVINYGVYSIRSDQNTTTVVPNDISRRIFKDTDYKYVDRLSVIKNYGSEYAEAPEDIKLYQASLIGSQIVSSEMVRPQEPPL